MKTFLLRLDDGQAAQIQTIARVDRLPIVDEIREAIAAHIEARRADPEFQKRLQLAMERERETYEDLCPPSQVISLAGRTVRRTGSGDQRGAAPSTVTDLMDVGDAPPGLGKLVDVSELEAP
jgi:hypothetical protein